jgi:hypothetical protein
MSATLPLKFTTKGHPVKPLPPEGSTNWSDNAILDLYAIREFVVALERNGLP